MGDWMFASESEPADVGRSAEAAQPDRWDDATAGVARRLQAGVDRHLWMLERQRPDPLGSDSFGTTQDLPELLASTRRMRRDTESLLLLGGQDPGVRTGGSRRLSDILGDAAAAAEEPRRVDVRTAPAATVTPGAAVEFLHVLAELVDHVTAAYPGARVEVAGRVEQGGVCVDLGVSGADRHDPDAPGSRTAVAAAEQLARRSRCRIGLRRPPAGLPPTGSGLVASVHCPAGVVTVEQQQARPRVPVGDLGRGPRGPAQGNGYGPEYGTRYGNGNGGGPRANGVGHRAASLVSGPPAPAFAPSLSSQVDELFGPLLDLPLEPIDDRYATPIFEAIASAWFLAGEQGAPQAGNVPGRGPGPVDWESPHDTEWRAAAARAARPDPVASTPSGLPRRRPGNQLVPPPRLTDPTAGPAERVPDRVRDRLSTYQRGLRQGRHRAPGPEGSDRDGG